MNFESDKDRENELKAAITLALRYKVKFFKRADGSEIDFEIFRDGKRVAWAEYKRRYHNRQKYPTLYISLNKITAGLEKHRETGLPFVLIIEWDDGFFWLHPSRCDYEIRHDGRNDRGADSPVGTVAHFDVELFKPL
jgi:hypothetical protein